MRQLRATRLGRAVPTGSRRKTEKPVRRRAAPRWVPGALWFGGVMLVVVVLSASVAWLWTSGRVSAALDSVRVALVDATVAAGFTVRDIRVIGRNHVTYEAVVEALAVDVGEPLVTLDPSAARDRLVSLGWVREATVERLFPDTVTVRLEERIPLALWQRKAKLVVVDRDGVVIGGVRAGEFARLPVIVGDDAPAHAANLLAVMAAQPSLGERVKSAIRVGGRRWNVRLDNGIEVRLPEGGVAEAWRRLAEFERRNGLLERGIVAVDLRQPDRLVIRRVPLPPDRGGQRT